MRTESTCAATARESGIYESRTIRVEEATAAVPYIVRFPVDAREQQGSTVDGTPTTLGSGCTRRCSLLSGLCHLPVHTAALLKHLARRRTLRARSGRVRIAYLATCLIVLGACGATAPASREGEPATVGSQGPLYTCGGPSFQGSALNGPLGAEEGTSQAANALRAHLSARQGSHLPRRGWRELSRSERRVVFGAGNPPHLTTVEVTQSGRGWTHASTRRRCRPEAVLGALRASAWQLAPRAALGHDTTVVPVIIREEHCRPDGPSPQSRLVPPVIAHTAQEVRVTYFVRRRPRDFEECLRVTDFPYQLQLGEPLGGRRLVDGRRLPPLAPNVLGAAP